MNKLQLRVQWFDSESELIEWYNESSATTTINIISIVYDKGNFGVFYYG